MMTTHPHAQPGAQPDASFLSPLAAEDDRAFPALRARLAQEAARDGILDVAYRTIDTPVGGLLLAATERGCPRWPVRSARAYCTRRPGWTPWPTSSTSISPGPGSRSGWTSTCSSRTGFAASCLST